MGFCATCGTGMGCVHSQMRPDIQPGETGHPLLSQHGWKLEQKRVIDHPGTYFELHTYNHPKHGSIYCTISRDGVDGWDRYDSSHGEILKSGSTEDELKRHLHNLDTAK